jgi:hypothetical protein
MGANVRRILKLNLNLGLNLRKVENTVKGIETPHTCEEGGYQIKRFGIA